MPSDGRIYVLGITSLTDDEDEAMRDLGQGIHLAGKQLVTAKGISGVAQAVAHGFQTAGGKPQWIDSGTVPDSRDVLIFADATYAARIREKVPDLDKRGWLIIPSTKIFDFHMDLLKALAEKNIHLPAPVGGGRSGGSPGIR